MRQKTIYAIITSLLLLPLMAFGQNQWDSNGIQLASSTGTQLHMDAVSDGSGGLFIVYEESSLGDIDIHARWIDGSGDNRWGSSGMTVVSSAGNQTYPAVVADGSGGIIVVWQDEITQDIYAQHLGSSGQITGPPSGFPVCSAVSQ